MEPAINQQMLTAFKQTLLGLQAELHALESTVEEAGEQVELDQTRIGRLSRMDAMQAQQMALEIKRRRKLQLQQIEHALKKIDTGDYGYCFSCDKPIALQRLEANPLVTRCITCINVEP